MTGPHTFHQADMIRTLELRIPRPPGMMVLQYFNGSSEMGLHDVLMEANVIKQPKFTSGHTKDFIK
jgi:hypothetical protein